VDEIGDAPTMRKGDYDSDDDSDSDEGDGKDGKDGSDGNDANAYGRDVYNANVSSNGNNNGLGNGMSRSEVLALNRDIMEKKQWDAVNAERKGLREGKVERRVEGKVSMSPGFKEFRPMMRGSQGDGYGVD
jgi:hypothetical protein